MAEIGPPCLLEDMDGTLTAYGKLVKAALAAHPSPSPEPPAPEPDWPGLNELEERVRVLEGKLAAVHTALA